MRDELYCTPSSRIVNIDYETPMDHKVNPNFQFQLCINLSDEEMFFRGFSHRSAMNNLWRHSKNYLPKGRSGQERNDWNCDILCELLLSSSFGTNKSGLCQCYQQTYLCLHFCIYLWLQVDIWKVFSEVLTCPLAWFWSYIFLLEQNSFIAIPHIPSQDNNYILTFFLPVVCCTYSCEWWIILY